MPYIPFVRRVHRGGTNSVRSQLKQIRYIARDQDWDPRPEVPIYTSDRIGNQNLANAMMRPDEFDQYVRAMFSRAGQLPGDDAQAVTSHDQTMHFVRSYGQGVDLEQAKAAAIDFAYKYFFEGYNNPGTNERESFDWYAGFHCYEDEANHPHLHIVVWRRMRGGGNLLRMDPNHPHWNYTAARIQAIHSDMDHGVVTDLNMAQQERDEVRDDLGDEGYLEYLLDRVGDYESIRIFDPEDNQQAAPSPDEEARVRREADLFRGGTPLRANTPEIGEDDNNGGDGPGFDDHSSGPDDDRSSLSSSDRGGDSSSQSDPGDDDRSSRADENRSSHSSSDHNGDSSSDSDSDDEGLSDHQHHSPGQWDRNDDWSDELQAQSRPIFDPGDDGDESEHEELPAQDMDRDSTSTDENSDIGSVRGSSRPEGETASQNQSQSESGLPPDPASPSTEQNSSITPAAPEGSAARAQKRRREDIDQGPEDRSSRRRRTEDQPVADSQQDPLPLMIREPARVDEAEHARGERRQEIRQEREQQQQEDIADPDSGRRRKTPDRQQSGQAAQGLASEQPPDQTVSAADNTNQPEGLLQNLEAETGQQGRGNQNRRQRRGAARRPQSNRPQDGISRLTDANRNLRLALAAAETHQRTRAPGEPSIQWQQEHQLLQREIERARREVAVARHGRRNVGTRANPLPDTEIVPNTDRAVTRSMTREPQERTANTPRGNNPATGTQRRRNRLDDPQSR